MKLSAPPPPPPPPEPPEPGSPAPDENASANAPAPPPAESAAPIAAKALAWPAWFAGADFVLAALAVGLAFLVASFVARNSEVWLHLAAGQRLLAGEYRPGTDPFSYTATDRTWVNHSLLYDVGAYLLYRSNPTGMVLVLVKALIVAAAFGLLIGIRRPGFPLWPWAAVAVVAVIASALRLSLSPLVGSVFLLAVTLFLLFRLSHRPNSWRFPIAIGITFWIWANVDGWFFIGPAALALVLIGELLQRRFGLAPDPASAGEPLGPLPDVPTLAKALGIGLVVCMLNPHHVRVWELPFELAGAPGAEQDPRIKQILMSPFSPDYSKDSPRGRMLGGYNLNGVAYVVLFIGGGLALGLGARRLQMAHLALFAGFALLSLATIYAIPFFAVVTVPIIASQLNAISDRFTLKSWGDPKSRFILFGSAGGRVVCILATAIACVLAWPGWLHPDTGVPAFARRVGWSIYSDAAMVRAAKQLQDWRASGSLPDDARGIITSLELANYCAWYAPREKVFLNARYNLHRHELPDYIAIRKSLAPVSADEAPDPKKLQDELEKRRIVYVAVHGGPGDGSMRAAAVQTSVVMWLDAEHWSPWYLNGRTVIAGWRSGPGHEQPTFSALRMDPVALAFGPRAERLPPGEVKPIPPVIGWEDEFIRGENISPAGADEALGWHDYGALRNSLIEQRQQLCGLIFLGVDHTVGGAGGVSHAALPALIAVIHKSLSADELSATPFLALRAARRAIAVDPDHPDGYYALAVALNDNRLPMSPDERAVGRVTALRQFLMRVPPPERYKRGSYLASPTQVAVELAYLYLGVQPGAQQFRGMPVNLPEFQFLLPSSMFLADLGGGQLRRVSFAERGRYQRIVGGPYLLPLDLARDMFLLAEKYAAADSAGPEEEKRIIGTIREWLKPVEAQYTAANNRYEIEKESARVRGGMKLRDQVERALQNNLVGEALRLLTDPGTDLQKEFGREALQVVLLRVTLELATGRLEDAAADIEILPVKLDELAGRPEDAREMRVDLLREMLRLLTYQKLFLEGNYSEAGLLFERTRMIPAKMGIDPDLPPALADAKPEPFIKSPNVLPVLSELPVWVVLPALPTTPVVAVATIEGLYRPHLFDQLMGRGILRQRTLNERRIRDANLYWKRGLLFLLEGNIGEARKRLVATRQSGVPEWGVPDQRHPEAERYLRLIDEAEKSAK